MEAELGVTAYGGWGYLHSGHGWLPRFYDPKDPANRSYADYFQGHPRLCDGKLVPLPTMSLLALGTNDMSAAGIQEAMQAYLPVERAICGDQCRLFQIVPPYGMLRQEINA